MSVRTFDPKTPEIFPSGRCTAGCGKEYHSICRLCNLAYCFEHLKLKPHACDTKWEHKVQTLEESLEEVDLDTCCALPNKWDSSPKGCFAQHPMTREICQLPVDGHDVHQRLHPNGTELMCWVGKNGSSP